MTDCTVYGCPFRINGSSNPWYCAQVLCRERARYNSAQNLQTQVQTSFEDEAHHQINELMQTLDKERSVMITLKTERDKLFAENRDLRNELCVLCGKYKREHEGACDGCRWRK